MKVFLIVIGLLIALAGGLFFLLGPRLDDDTDPAGRRGTDREPRPEEVAWKVFTDALDSRNDDLRMETLEVMSELRDDRVARYRDLALERDSAAIVRLRAAALAARAGRKDLLPMVRAIAATEDDYEAYVEAARAYGFIGTPECIPELVAILTAKDDIDSDEDSMPHAAAWLGRLGARDQIPLLREQLDHDDEEVVFGAACGLLLLGETDVLPRLLAGIEDDSDLIVPFLAWPGEDAGIPVLAATMASDEPFESERGGAATALADIGTDKARAALETAWAGLEGLSEAERRDQAEFERYLSAALARLDDARGLAALADAATGPDDALALQALRGATALGRGIAVPTLLEVIGTTGYRAVKRPDGSVAPQRFEKKHPDEDPTHSRRLVWLWAARAILAAEDAR